MRLAQFTTLLLVIPVFATGQATEPDFEQCKRRLESAAVASGIGAETAGAVLAQVEQLPRVIASDRKQAEFTQTFTDYYARRVTPERVERGRALYDTHAELLARIERRTGVPPHYLLALWGLETNFGTYFGTLPIPSALTTLACDPRRPEFFAEQLFAVLRMIESGDARADELVGSWAGALGHMQFMPTTFMRHAVDADGDGRRDLYGSLDDALTSGAGYLASLGWQSGYRWGREVVLPDGFDFSATGSDRWRPLADWRGMGVRDTFGRALPDLDLNSAIVLPAGHKGPAFVVYPNFTVIMRWNQSEFYALSVGRLADRIAGAGRLKAPLPDNEAIGVQTTELIALQENLTRLGFEPGQADGVLGPATRRAIQSFQQQQGMLADGYPNAEVLRAVRERI